MREISRLLDVPKSTDDIKLPKKPEPIKTVEEEAEKSCKNRKKPSTNSRNAGAFSKIQLQRIRQTKLKIDCLNIVLISS
jgi:hypothetical protein